jgi:hypothetical protein
MISTEKKSVNTDHTPLINTEYSFNTYNSDHNLIINNSGCLGFFRGVCFMLAYNDELGLAYNLFLNSIDVQI